MPTQPDLEALLIDLFERTRGPTTLVEVAYKLAQPGGFDVPTCELVAALDALTADGRIVATSFCHPTIATNIEKHAERQRASRGRRKAA